MSATVSDIIEGHISEDASAGYSVERVFMVSGVSGAAHARGYNALNAPGVPRLFEGHPSIPSLFCSQRTATPMGDSSDRFRVTCRYKLPDFAILQPDESAPGLISVGGGLSQVATQKDVDGNAISVTYTYPDDHGDKTLAGRSYTQGGEVGLMVPVTVLRETRRESVNPNFKARAYVGRVNSFPIWNGAARTYLCTRIEGESRDGGESYEVAYEFQYKPEGWDASVVFRDLKTNRPIPNPDAEALKTVPIYAGIDFGGLNLNL